MRARAAPSSPVFFLARNPPLFFPVNRPPTPRALSSRAPPFCRSHRAEFLAVGRRQDKIILCSRVHSQDKSYDYMEKVKMVMNSPGWATVTTDKLSLEDGGYMFWVSIDEVRFFAAGAPL